MITRLKHSLAGQKFKHDIGSVTAIIGPNGSGKTTVLNAIQFALTGQLAHPVDGRKPAKTNTDLADMLLPAGCKSASVTTEIGSETIDRKLSLSKSGAVSLKTIYSGARKGAKAAEVQGAINQAHTLDPLAWSLSSWLSQTGPKRIAEMLEFAAEVEPNVKAMDGIKPGLQKIVRDDGIAPAIDEARAVITEAQREARSIEQRIQADHAELSRTETPNRSRDDIEAELSSSRARLADVEAELKALDIRSADYTQALARVDKARREFDRLNSGYDPTAQQQRIDSICEIESRAYELSDTSSLEFDLECAADDVEEASNAVAVADAFAAVSDHLCDDCRANLGAVSFEDAFARRQDAEAKRDKIKAALERMRRDNDDAEKRKTADASAIGTLKGQVKLLEERGLSVERARIELVEAKHDAARFAPSDHQQQLNAEVAGLRSAVVTLEAARESGRIASTIEARIAEQQQRLAELRDGDDERKEQLDLLIKLRADMLVVGMAPLNDAADKIYYGATGGHINFDPEHGTVVLFASDGKGRHIEAASVGERALAFPAISIALQRARGCERPTLILDGLESCDLRFELLEQCRDLVRSGDLHQAIATWTALYAHLDDEEREVDDIDDVTVIRLEVAR